MYTRVSPWTVFGSVLVIGGALLACKGKKEETPAASPETTTTAAPTTTAAQEMPTKTFNVGDTAKALDYSLSVENVKECRPKYYFSKPKKGSIWLGAELVVTSISDKQVWSNPSYAKLIDADGLTYNYSFATTKDCDPTLNATQLNKSEKAKGWVIFEVPEKSKGLKLTYNPSSFGTPQQVKFDLGKLPGEEAEAKTETKEPEKTAEAPKTTTTAPKTTTTAPKATAQPKTTPAKTSTPTTGAATTAKTAAPAVTAKPAETKPAPAPAPAPK